jgi:hypothetical protein
MDAKLKAQELVEKFRLNVIDYEGSGMNQNEAKQSALIAVNFHIEELSKMKLIFSDRELHLKKWESVKSELQKL